MKNISKIRAFTLIELLVVIAIIAILTSIVMTSFGPSKQKARDAKRISDIGTIQLALELYFDRCKEYPTKTGLAGTVTNDLAVTMNNGCPAATPAISLGSYISTIPTSASPNNYIYTVSSTYNDYVLAVQLEKYNEILRDDLDETPVTGASCGTQGANELIYCIGPK